MRGDRRGRIEIDVLGAACLVSWTRCSVECTGIGCFWREDKNERKKSLRKGKAPVGKSISERSPQNGHDNRCVKISQSRRLSRFEESDEIFHSDGHLRSFLRARTVSLIDLPLLFVQLWGPSAKLASVYEDSTDERTAWTLQSSFRMAWFPSGNRVDRLPKRRTLTLAGRTNENWVSRLLDGNRPRISLPEKQRSI